MIGMDFISFLVLLIISVVVAVILHCALKFYVVPGTTSFLSKVIIGWIGAWLGSPVFGHWWEPLKVCEIYIIPAILGALAILVLAVDVVRTCQSACGGEKGAGSTGAGTPM